MGDALTEVVEHLVRTTQPEEEQAALLRKLGAGDADGLEDFNANDAKEEIADSDDVDELRRWRDLEADGKDRSTVLAAIDARIEELEE